jgi:antitoxin (DNA-binding transcriptional repressor) of toxin-antitoxin stability system
MSLKTVELQDPTALAPYVPSAPLDRVVVTRDGKPVALVVSLTGYDAEDLARMSDPDFWRMIEERRKVPKEQCIPLEQVEREIGLR